jgi:hypothetical protein
MFSPASSPPLASSPSPASVGRVQHHPTKQRDVPFASLLSVTSPSKAFQVLWFLNFGPPSAKKHRRILFRSLIIFGLSVAAILSGPIAGFASRQGQAAIPVEMHGSLATTTWDSMAEADVAWAHRVAPPWALASSGEPRPTTR